jgi:hypothetical protein
MAKLINPLHSLGAVGQFTKDLVIRNRGKTAILENKPFPTDAKTSAQLAWRTMYQLAVSLWHTLSPVEQAVWETLARQRHMTGYAYFLSQALRPNPGIYLPLAGGTMSGDIVMATKRITNLPAPVADEEPSRKIDLASHLANAVHTQPQDPAAHGNEKHTSTFITQDAVNTHAALTSGIHGAGASTLETITGAQAKVNTHATLTTGVHAFNKSCRLWNNATQSIPNETPTAITFNTEKWDTDDMHSLISNTHLITCKTAGTYAIVASMEFSPSGTGNRQLYIYKNATELQIYAIEWSPAPLNSQLLWVFCLVNLEINDTIQAKAYQNSGGALNSLANNPYTPQLSATRLT